MRNLQRYQPSSSVSKDTIDRALVSAGKVMASFQKRKDVFHDQLLECFRTTLSGDRERARVARDSAFTFARLYAQAKHLRERPSEEFETMLLGMGAAVERCLSSLDEREFETTFLMEWHW